MSFPGFLHRLVLTAILAGAAPAAEPPRWLGLVTLAGQPQLYLADRGNPQLGRWLPLDATFLGYRLAALEKEEPCLVLSRGENLIYLHLPHREPAAPAPRLARRLRVQHAGWSQDQAFVLVEGRATTLTLAPGIRATLRMKQGANGTVHYATRFERGEPDPRPPETVVAPAVVARPDQSVSLRFADLDLEITPL